jgi:hypothetical protein
VGVKYEYCKRNGEDELDRENSTHVRKAVCKQGFDGKAIRKKTTTKCEV